MTTPSKDPAGRAEPAEGSTGSPSAGRDRTRERVATIANPLRLAIVARLQLEPASAAELAEGLEIRVESVRHQLRKLSHGGQVKRLGKTRRRGVAEYLYCADPRCTILGPGGLSAIPNRLVDEAQARLLRLLFGEAVAALDAHISTSRDEHVSTVIRFPLSLDERGWKEAGEVHANLVEDALKEIERAKARLQGGAEGSISAFVGILFCENTIPGWPAPPSEEERRSSWGRRKPSAFGSVLDITMTDPARSRMLDALNIEPTSAAELAERIEMPLGKVRYELNRLLREGIIRIHAEQMRRGTVERIYIGESRNLIWSDREMADLTANDYEAFSRVTVNRLFREVLEATKAGAFHDRDDFCLARVPMRIDREGLQEIHTLFDASLERLLALRDRCINGLSEGESPARIALSGLLLF